MLLLLLACDSTVTVGAADAVVLPFTPSASGGYDDWSSPGAALAWATDDASGRAVVVGMRFDLPIYEVELVPLDDAGRTAAGWDTAEVGIGAPEHVRPVLTDTAGLLGMPGELTAILLDGDRTWVADRGSAELTREEGDVDFLSADLGFTEVNALGEGAAALGDRLAIEGLDVSWATGAQP